MKKLFKNKIFVGILCIVLSLIVCFVIGPISELFTSRNQTVVRAIGFIPKGEKITESQVESVDVGKYNLPIDICVDKKAVVGTYSKYDLQAGDYLTQSKISKELEIDNAYLNDLPENKLAISVDLHSSANSLSGKLRAGDIVSIFADPPMYQSGTDGEIISVDTFYDNAVLSSYALACQQLKYVKILAVTNVAEADVIKEDNGFANENDKLNAENATKTEERTIQTVTLLLDYDQSALIAGLNAKSNLHCALACRGNEKKAEELLAQQDETSSLIEKNNEERKATNLETYNAPVATPVPETEEEITEEE